MSAPAREQVLDLRVDGVGVTHRHRDLVVVEVVLRLLRHGEGAGHRDLDRMPGVGAQKRDVAHLHRMLAADRADDARHRTRLSHAVEADAGVLDVHALERRRETIGIALAPHFAIRDDVDAGAFLVADRQDGRIVLRLLQPFRRDAPQVPGPQPRHEFPERGPIDQPIGLRIASNQGGRENGVHEPCPRWLPERFTFSESR